MSDSREETQKEVEKRMDELGKVLKEGGWLEQEKVAITMAALVMMGRGAHQLIQLKAMEFALLTLKEKLKQQSNSGLN